MHMVTTMSVLIEAERPLVMAQFWADLFGVPVSAGSSDVSASLVASAQSVQLVFEKTDEPKVFRNRVRLQLVSEDFDRQLHRLLVLGTEFASPGLGSLGTRSVELMDPEGNEFTLHARTRVA
jgi:predicted enzyme related to lactoylglutathione lyase